MSTFPIRGRLIRLTSLFVVFVLAMTVVASGAEASNKRPRPPKLAGMVYAESSHGFEDTWTALNAALDANPNLRTIRTIDHSAAAAGVGLELAPNRVVFFGNPAIGTSLMQANQTAGIDLPQKIQVIEDRGKVFVGFNDATYLAARHDLEGEPSLDTIAGALRNLTEAATGPDAASRTKNARRFSKLDRLVTKPSNADIDTTWDRLISAIEASPANIALELDHQANAASVGLELRPTRLVVFGNPQLGTPIMQNKPTAGIDLPLKILVWEDAKGDVQVTTNRTGLFKTKHKVRGADFSAINGAIGNFMDVATGD